MPTVPVNGFDLELRRLDLDVLRDFRLCHQPPLDMRRKHRAVPVQVPDLWHLALCPFLQALRKLPGDPFQNHEVIPEPVNTTHCVLDSVDPVFLQITEPVTVRLGRRTVTTRKRD